MILIGPTGVAWATLTALIALAITIFFVMRQVLDSQDLASFLSSKGYSFHYSHFFPLASGRFLAIILTRQCGHEVQSLSCSRDLFSC